MNQLKRLRKSGSKKSLVKKYNVPSQIITRSLSKKNNKIYTHHDDDNNLNAKDITIIERVNDDCLTEIFMHVPACERPKIALVCKKWKRVLDYSWFNVKKLELTHWEYDENPHFLERNYPRINGQFKFLKSLLYKCGRYLRELDLSVYTRCNILPVINEYCPNLIKLRIRIGDIDDAILDNAFSHLSKLKVLKIIFHGCFDDEHRKVPTTLINSLLNVADTLTDLNIANWAAALCKKAFFPAEMTSVVIQLKALRKFGADCIVSPRSMREYLNNSETIRSTSDHNCYNKIKMSTTELFERVEELDILTWGISDDCIYNIANVMKRLHTLRVSCPWLTDAGIAACSKINNLKNLYLDGFNDATDSSIKLLKNLTHLKLPYSNKITDESAIKVLENSPDMIEYCVKNTGITFNFIEKAAEISESRDRELTVFVSLDSDLFSTRTEYDCLSIFYVKKNTTK
ncbi:uncharacterized protein LOC122858021 isoform X1 [Aphidius gifuensis]|uniref:uncharacterized protein LOC122858021 isoform X1 n=2 Tax=Aphidius gifuensis TaxID=684658 RepID=UPI001CDC63E8|nr:uncharacterized protein LOC122858021 isoform X1 [Aphidius gifuensis]